jgi:hypothetical protein
LARERFQTGNHVRIYLRGDSGDLEKLGFGTVGAHGGPFGEGSSIDMASDSGARPVHVVGESDPVDIVDGAHSHTITLSTMRLRDVAAARALEAGRAVIEEVDKYTNKVIQTAEDCQLVSHRLTVSANQLVARNVTFTALRIH